MAIVLNHRHFRQLPANSVYVGRPSKWGNPFSLDIYPRDTAVTLYENWLQGRPELLAALTELRGKHLVCWCAPKRCHADILLRLANS